MSGTTTDSHRQGEMCTQCLPRVLQKNGNERGEHHVEKANGGAIARKIHHRFSIGMLELARRQQWERLWPHVRWTQTASRASNCYELANGTIPEGLEIDHLCRNRGCMNPAHMQAVTPQDHMRRHWKTHCKRGHPLSGDNLRIIVRGKRMMRICRECNRARKRAYYYGQPLEG